MTNEEKQPAKKQQRRRRGHGEGSVFYRKDRDQWIAQITLEKGGTKQTYHDTQREALAARNQMLRELEQGTLVTEKDQTVKQYFEHWLEEVHKPLIRENTYIKYRSIFHHHILPTLGDERIQRLTPQQVQSLYSRKLKEGLAAKTIQGIHNVLHSGLKKAVRWGLVSRNVCEAVSPPRAKKREMHTLTLEQMHQFLDAAKEHYLEPLFVLALVTGMRQGELLALRWSDINFAESLLYVQRSATRLPGKGVVESEPKTAKGRRNIQLPSMMLSILVRHKATQAEAKRQAKGWQEHDLIFCTAHGTPLAASSARRSFKTFLKKNNLPGIRFHDLRHSSATLLLSMGVHAKVVQEILGHSQISMTMDIYSHVLPSMQKNAMDKWNDLL